MRPLALALLAVLLLLLAPPLAGAAVATASDITIHGARRLTDPVPAISPIEVEADVEGNVTSLSLIACKWDPATRNASYCLAPEAMTKGADGKWRARIGGTAEGFPGGSTAGYKLIARNATGAEAHWPVHEEYELFTVEPLEMPTPAPGPLAPLAALALAAGVAGRALRRSS